MRDRTAEREEADRRYNEALTALDRSIPPPAASAEAIRPPQPLAPVVPRGLRGRLLRAIGEWLAPVFERQHAVDTALVAAVNEIRTQERERAVAFERFQTSLIVFLQQITAFVESKDRELGARMESGFSGHQQAIETLPELREQVAVVQRATQMLRRELEAPRTPLATSDQPHAAPGPSTLAPDSSSAYQYVGFEDRFRGSDAEIRQKQMTYVPLFEGATDVLDIGCGRGEFLLLLKEHGIRARGVDLNHEMIATARGHGLDVTESDALVYLEGLEDGSLGGIIAAQVVEHLPPQYLMRLLSVAFHKLGPQAPIVIETINPACWLAFFSSYLRDPTHVQPVHPETLKYLLQANGFGRATIQYSAPVAEHTRMAPLHLPAPVLEASDTISRVLVDTANVINRNGGILNNLLFSDHDYAAIAYRS